MQLETVKINPFVSKQLRILFYPWRKYSQFFDNGCWGIWSLSPLLKFTFLFLALFFVPPIIGVVHYEDRSTEKYFSVITIIFLLIAFVWLIYLPILCAVTFVRAVKKTKRAVQELSKTLSEQPWDITPIKLYTQPHSGIVVFLYFLRDYLVDIVDWTTQFYPISLLPGSYLKYPLSTKVRHNTRSFEIEIALMKIPLRHVKSEVNQQFTLYKFELYQDVKDFTKVVKKMTKHFQEGYTFYVREENGQILIQVPHAQYDN